MQEKNKFLPMVKNYIRENMPSGGYQMVSKRLESKGVTVKGHIILNEVKILKNNSNIPLVSECILFLKENNIALDNYCEDFIRKEDIRKAG